MLVRHRRLARPVHLFERPEVAVNLQPLCRHRLRSLGVLRPPQRVPLPPCLSNEQGCHPLILCLPKLTILLRNPLGLVSALNRPLLASIKQPPSTVRVRIRSNRTLRVRQNQRLRVRFRWNHARANPLLPPLLGDRARLLARLLELWQPASAQLVNNHALTQLDARRFQHGSRLEAPQLPDPIRLIRDSKRICSNRRHQIPHSAEIPLHLDPRPCHQRFPVQIEHDVACLNVPRVANEHTSLSTPKVLHPLLILTVPPRQRTERSQSLWPVIPQSKPLIRRHAIAQPVRRGPPVVVVHHVVLHRVMVIRVIEPALVERSCHPLVHAPLGSLHFARMNMARSHKPPLYLLRDQLGVDHALSVAERRRRPALRVHHNRLDSRPIPVFPLNFWPDLAQFALVRVHRLHDILGLLPLERVGKLVPYRPIDEARNVSIAVRIPPATLGWLEQIELDLPPKARRHRLRVLV